MMNIGLFLILRSDSLVVIFFYVKKINLFLNK